MIGVSAKRGLVERLADGAHAAVHHVRGRDHVRAGLHVRDRGARQQLQRGIVADGAVLHHAAVAVARVLAQAHVGDHQQIRDAVLHRAHRLLHDAVLRARPPSRADPSSAGSPNSSTAGMPMPAASLHSLISSSTESAVLAGHRADRLADPAAVRDEQRVDEVVDRQRGLAHHLAQQRLLT